MLNDASILQFREMKSTKNCKVIVMTATKPDTWKPIKTNGFFKNLPKE